jgi:hypothetical protein
MEDTPISQAMNQLALVYIIELLRHLISVKKDLLEIPSSS